MNGFWRIEPEWLFDGVRPEAQQGRCVLIRNGTIEAVGAAGELDGSGVEQVTRLPGVTIMPGLIDAHAHLTFCGCATPRQTLMTDSNEMLLLRAASAAREALWQGITTVRDCGDRDGVTFHLRDAIRRGIVDGPRLLLSGPPLTSPRGHCYFLKGEVEGRDQILAAIENRAARGADFVKVMATGGGMTPGTDSLGMQFEAEDLRFIVEQGRRFNLTVAAHAHSPESIAACVDAGVTTIEHASFVSAEGIAVDLATVARMAAAGVTVVPTNVPARNALRSGKALGLAGRIGMSPAEFVAARQQVVHALRSGGVRVIAGTDGGATNVRMTDLPGEIEMLSEAGLGAAGALAAATSESAAALGLSDAGRIGTGMAADLLGVRGNPLTDLTVLMRPVLVVQRGRVIRGEAA